MRGMGISRHQTSNHPPYRLTTNLRKRGICCSVQHVNSPNFGTGEVDEARRGVRISQEHTQCSLLHSRRDSTIAYTECSTQLHEQDEESQNSWSLHLSSCDYLEAGKGSDLSWRPLTSSYLEEGSNVGISPSSYNRSTWFEEWCWMISTEIHREMYTYRFVV